MPVPVSGFSIWRVFTGFEMFPFMAEVVLPNATIPGELCSLSSKWDTAYRDVSAP
ncbi:hypothetical protein RSAG8_00398, partial [Rhizoctonia solani AG-8 WAC10335]